MMKLLRHKNPLWSEWHKMKTHHKRTTKNKIAQNRISEAPKSLAIIKLIDIYVSRIQFAHFSAVFFSLNFKWINSFLSNYCLNKKWQWKNINPMKPIHFNVFFNIVQCNQEIHFYLFKSIIIIWSLFMYIAFWWITSPVWIAIIPISCWIRFSFFFIVNNCIL